NPHSFPVDTLVQMNINNVSLLDDDGNPVPCQSVRGYQTNGDDTRNTVFPVSLPGFGYATYYIYKDRESAGQQASLSASQNHLENDCLRVEFDPASGGISRFYDKKAGTELAGGVLSRALVIDDEPSDTWAHKIFTFDRVVGAFECTDITLLENGPLRACVRVTSRFGDSTLVQKYSLCAGSRELKVTCSLDFHEKHKIVKLSFPLASKDCRAVYSMPYGFIEKACTGTEEPGQEWAALIDKDTGRGLAVVNDCKYSFSAEGNELRMIAARSAIYADHFGQHSRDDRVEFLDQGELEFTYSLLPHNQNKPSATVRSAALLNQPPHVIFETHHEGALPTRMGGIEISADNVICKALKMAEDGTGFIARFFECAGIPTAANVRLSLLNCEFSLELNPQEIKTMWISPDGTECREVAITEWEL
ncbi:MAG: glycoside hydrolase family 38 C-terminal domain-containing protein, partial [Oscillospiraceae bacterium]